MGVIPIGDASSLADRMLQAEGYPLVLVDDWALISEARLATCSCATATILRWLNFTPRTVTAGAPLGNTCNRHHKEVVSDPVNPVWSHIW